MAYTSEQQRIARIALGEVRRRAGGLNPSTQRTLQLALLDAGIVESGLRNVNYGDRDSQGFLQQRPSMGWGSVAQVRDPRHATNKFLDAAIPLAKSGKYAPGQLAQAVQRSGFPGRYAQHTGESANLIRTFGGGAQAPRPTGRGAGGPATRTVTQTQQRFDQPGFDQAKKKFVLAQLLSKRHGMKSPLFSTGVLSTTPPDPGAFTSQVTTQHQVPVPGRPAARAAGRSAGGKPPLGQTPAQIINHFVVPLARKNGIDVSPKSVAEANARHGPTVSGGRSDHQGPSANAWAADLSNGSAPTPQMDRLARSLATAFGIPWSGSGLVSKTLPGGYRVQLIYRTTQGGNHFNHVHFGIRKA